MLRVSFYINECTVVRFLARSLTSYRRPPRWRSRCVSWPRYCWPRMCNFQNQTAGPRRWWDCGRPFSRWGLQRWALLHFSAIPPEKPINTCLPQTLFFFCRYSAAGSDADWATFSRNWGWNVSMHWAPHRFSASMKLLFPEGGPLIPG